LPIFNSLKTVSLTTVIDVADVDCRCKTFNNINYVLCPMASMVMPNDDGFQIPGFYDTYIAVINRIAEILW